MSYVSFLKNIPEVLTQPTGIAALASLSIHGAIAFILPLVPVDSSKSAKQTPTNSKPVGLTQLTPAEQSRLPQIPIPQSGSLQAQLPPLPGQIPSLPGQQQLPLNLPNTQPGLPPAPPPGAIMSAIPGSSALSLPPSLQTLPGNSSQRFNRRDLVIDPNFGLNPTASVNISRFPRSSRINNVGLGSRSFGSRSYSSANLPRPFVPSNLPEPPVTQPSNFPVAPPPLPPEATTNTTTPDNEVAAQVPQPENQTVTPDQYIAPVGNAPKPTEGNYTVAAQPVTPFQSQAGGINEIAAGTPSAGSTVPGTAPNAPTVNGETTKTISMLDAFTEAKKQYPEVQFSGAPIVISIPKSQLERNVEVAVRMDRQNKIDSVQLLEDGISIPSNNKLAVRERLLQYFKENPAALNGKGKLFTFRISPDGNVSSDKPTENKPSDRTLPAQPQNTTANENNQPAPVAPQGSNPTIKPFSGLQLNRNKPVTVPQVNTPTETNTPNTGSTVPTSIDKPSSEVTPVGGNRTTPPKLPNFKPKETSSPLDRVEPAPLLPLKRSGTQSAPTPQITAKPLVEKLRESQNQSTSEANSEQPSVVQKLRQFKQEQDSK
ncbi:hypothetical protein [Brunnivagina elsteri]|uniref:Uncharacterized protein n=1 Tax=Brunnivagina elsteri CCALA 953 TaxID=987040 RepID=A0A2A2TIX0_9CYAN|nr:hypothetical protein [Calothrix elsteri]PAX54149.1 hypothetical protein CK510_12755 [Calothrix elsteri CCALA 953]